MIVVTGAAGFIGSCMISELNRNGIGDIILVDDFSHREKKNNYTGKRYLYKVDREDFFLWLESNHKEVEMIFHIGARTDTTEFNMAVLDELNLNYSKNVWKACIKYEIPLIYASSAATYGDGAYGYNDDHSIIPSLQPLNPYGVSKNEFDKWVLRQKETPPYWYGLKFFNVYGPNEYHKGRMASVIFHSFKQVTEKGVVKLFRSHKPEYTDGGQLRDFIYVKDVTRVLFFLMWSHKNPGIYNLGTGKARTFLDLVTAVYASLNLPPVIEFIDTPEDIRDKYQYFTEANMEKLRNAGYSQPFSTLEEGISEYVNEYLVPGKYF